jgi:hypothetical protein
MSPEHVDYTALERLWRSEGKRMRAFYKCISLFLLNNVQWLQLLRRVWDRVGRRSWSRMSTRSRVQE